MIDLYWFNEAKKAYGRVARLEAALREIEWQANYEADSWEAADASDEIKRVAVRISKESIRFLAKMAHNAIERS